MSDEKSLASSVALLGCGSYQGTATLLGAGLALTPRHSLADRYDDSSIPITLRLPGEQQFANAELHAGVEIPVTEDMVILRFASSQGAPPPLPLAASHLPLGLQWESFGFPSGRPNGVAIRGTVARWLPDQLAPRDVELKVEDFTAFRSYRGFSGSPVIVDGRIVAVLQTQLEGGLAAVSVLHLREYLTRAGAPYETSGHEEAVPRPMQEAARISVPNTRTFWELENALSETDGKYIVLSGAPGSGKTLLSATFRPSDQRKRVLGRYFAGGDAEPGRLAPDILREATSFSEWLARQSAMSSRDARPSLHTHTLRQHAETVAGNLATLAAFSKSKGILGLLLIDDVLSTNGQLGGNSLLRTLPPTLPAGVVVILTTTNVPSLRSAIPDLPLHREVQIAPLDPFDCQLVVGRVLKGSTPSSTMLQIAQASEGNPLILSYLIREAQAAIEAGRTPTVSAPGHTTEQFYERQWFRIAENESAVWLLAIIARLRGLLSQAEITRIFPESHRIYIVGALRAVQHLLIQEDEGARFFHASLCDFVIRRTDSIDTEIQDRLAAYCISTPASDYGLGNLLLHHLRGSPEVRRRSTLLCTAQWTDALALEDSRRLMSSAMWTSFSAWC
jgi:hypothetical protein